MKICILLSSYEGTGSVFSEFDEYQNPGIYTKSHRFEQRFVKKENAQETIDHIVAEDFDYIWNFMWGTEYDNVAGIEATKYLESKNILMIGTSSKYLSITKCECKKAFELAKVKTPKAIVVTSDDENLLNFVADSGLSFPTIVKPSTGCGSEHLTSESVCHDPSQVMKQVKQLRSKIACSVLIEEFIDGDEISVMVLETKNGVIALTPLVYVFPTSRQPAEKFLDFETKFNGIDNGEVTYKLFDDDVVMMEKIKEQAVKAYVALGVIGSGYARVDLRLKDGVPYFLEVIFFSSDWHFRN